MELYLWLAGVYLASVVTSYFVGTVGLASLQTDLQNLHLQAPVSVLPVTPTVSPVVHVTTPAVHVTQTPPAATTPTS